MPIGIRAVSKKNFARKSVKSDKKLQSELDKGLEGTFPASDPPSSTEPAKSKRDAG
jgi:hypothetical protein